jgi:hypothetical protein
MGCNQHADIAEPESNNKTKAVVQPAASSPTVDPAMVGASKLHAGLIAAALRNSSCMVSAHLSHPQQHNQHSISIIGEKSS